VAAIYNIVLPILAGLSILAVFFFLYRAITGRSKAAHQAYDVGRVASRQKAQVNLIRALFSLLLALFFLGLVAIGPRMAAVFPAATWTPTPTAVPPDTPTAEATATTAPTPAQETPTAVVPTASATAPPTNTPTPEPLSATVSSGVGVYLRGGPTINEPELEYLPPGSIVIILEGQQVADELQWQQVQTESGQVGWVASDFITINEP
jgi:hypothetical protein